MLQQNPQSKKAALARMQQNDLLQEVYWKVPLLRAVVDYAIQQLNNVGYDRDETYSLLKAYASLFVGWGALDEKFATTPYFEAVMSTINDLLPADDIDIYASWEDIPVKRQEEWEKWIEQKEWEEQEAKEYAFAKLHDKGLRTLHEYLTEGFYLQERWYKQAARIKAGELPPGYDRNETGKIILKNPSRENVRKLEEEW